MEHTKTMTTAFLAESFLEQMEIRYYLICGDCVENPSVPAYGIEARLYRDGELKDDRVIGDISCSREEIVGLIGLLSKNSVTPVTLEDVIDDYLAEK